MLMAQTLFEGSNTKLARSLKFIDELEAALDEYNGNDPVSGKYVMTNGAPQIRLDWKGMDPVPGAILGDAIHNLRSALDLMASELARINAKDDSDVYFPFASSATYFEQAVRSKNFHKAGQDAIDLLRTFAPYKGGNECLRAIHDLDIRDKHTAIIDTQKTMEITFTVQYDITKLESGAVALNPTTITHAFWTETPLAGRPIIETLKMLVQLVNGILGAFRQMVQNRK